MPKFFIDDSNIKGNDIYIEKDYNHIKNVLRKDVGDQLQICNIDNSKNYICEIKNFENDYIKCEIVEETKENVESNIKVSIYQGLPKSEKMELVIQKSVELGAYNIIPLEMKRCIVKLNEKDKLKKIQRWQKISEVASKQCGRDIIPKIESVCNINELCKDINNYDIVLVAYEDEKNNTLKDEINMIKLKNNIKKIAVVIGPEGGIDITEIEKLKKSGAKIVTLGKRILRTETVALYLTGIILYELEN